MLDWNNCRSEEFMVDAWKIQVDECVWIYMYFVALSPESVLTADAQ